MKKSFFSQRTERKYYLGDSYVSEDFYNCGFCCYIVLANDIFILEKEENYA